MGGTMSQDRRNERPRALRYLGVFMASAVSVLLLSLGVSNGLECLEPGQLDPWQTGFCQESTLRNLVAAGGFACVHTNTDIRVLDVSDPVDPEVVFTCVPYLGTPQNIYVGGDWLLVETNTPRGIEIMSRGADGSLEYLARIEIGTGLRNAVVYGSVLYLAENGNGLIVYDLSDPTAPVQRNHLFAGRYIWLHEIVGDHLYMSRDYNPRALVALSLSDPFAPVPVGETGTIAPRGFLVDGTMGYGVNSFDTLAVYDLADPAHPVFRGSVYLAFHYSDMIMLGERLLIVGYSPSQFVLFDVSDPATPRRLWDVDDIPPGWDIEPVGEAIYFGGSDDCYHILSTVPLSPLTASIAHSTYATSCAVRDTVLFVAGGDLVTISIADPDAPRVLGRAALPGNGNNARIALYQNAAYISSSGGGFDVVDVSNLSEPIFVGTWDSPGYSVTDLEVVPPCLVLVGSGNGPAVYKLTNPLSPVLRGYNSSPTAYWIEVKPPYAFIENANGLALFEIYDSGYFHFVQMLDVPSTDPVEIFGDYLFACGGSGGGGGLCALDISDPRHSQVLSCLPDWCGRGSFDGRFFYFREHDGITHVIDYGDIYDPIYRGEFPIPGWITDLRSVGSRVFWLGRTEGVFTSLPMCQGTVPVEIADLRVVIDRGWHVVSWRITGRIERSTLHLYCDQDSQREEVSFEEIEPGLCVARHCPGAEVSDVVFGLYAGNRLVGRVVSTVPTLDLEADVRISPNPANPSLTVTYIVPRRQRVHVGVYDLRGRLVISLDDGYRTAGEHVTTWSGLDSRGQLQASGVYVVQCAGDDYVRSRRVTLVK